MFFMVAWQLESWTVSQEDHGLYGSVAVRELDCQSRGPWSLW